MTSPAPSLHPRLADSAIPISVLRLSAGSCDPQAELGLAPTQLHPVGEDVLSARVEVPPGEWLVWPEAGYAMWIGRRLDALPAPVRRRLAEWDAWDLPELLNALADASVWLREAALLIGDDWTPSRRADVAFSAISTVPVAALSGIFVDRSGRSARLEVAAGGVCWTDRPALAVEWLLAVVDLPAPQ